MLDTLDLPSNLDDGFDDLDDMDENALN